VTYTEMRVHGVSGTPPREMLYSDPVTYDQTGSHTKVFRPTRSGGFETSAFHWGSLTSGSWVTAFWVLLAPFAFANVAGWMMTTRGPWSRTWVRWAGLCLTCLLVAQGAVVLIDLPYHWIVDKTVELPLGSNATLPPWSIGLGVIALTAGFVFLVWRLSTRSHFVNLNGRTQFNLVFSPKTEHLLPPRYWNPSPALPNRCTHPHLLTKEEQWDDPGDGLISDRALWQEHALLHRLRRIHLGSGFAVVALSLAVGSQSWWLGAFAAIPILLGFALIALTAFKSRSSWAIRTTALFPILGLGFLVGTAGVSLSEIAGQLPTKAHWTGVHELTFVVALALGLTAFGTWLSQVFGAWRERRFQAVRRGWVSLGALTVATLLGSSLGMAAVLWAESWLGVDEITTFGVGWVAVAMLLLLVSVLGAIGVVILWGHYFPGKDTPCKDYPLEEAATNGTRVALIRRITRRASWLFNTASLYGVVAAITAGVVAWAPERSFPLSPTELSASAPYLTIATAVVWGLATWTLSLALFEYNGGMAWAVLLGGSALLLAVGFNLLPEITVLGISLDLSTLEDLGKLLLILGPAAMVAKGIVTRSTGGSDKRRRGIGLLWDVGSLWPRWFHPLGPPSYGPDAVCHLLVEIHRKRPDRPDVLSAHSQGSLISAIAISQANPSEVAEMGFLTYGSPIGLLYKPLFPDVGIDDMVRDVERKLRHRPWINLWRRTDYLGGCPVGLAKGDREVESGVGHSLYELTDEFCHARNEAAGAPIKTPCW